MKKFVVPIFALLIVAFFLCKYLGRNASSYIDGVHDLDLSLEQVNNLRKQVASGNASAALMLSRYYEFVRMDHNEMMKWRTKAAELGDATAKKEMEQHSRE